jgi:hypothetical protein
VRKGLALWTPQLDCTKDYVLIARDAITVIFQSGITSVVVNFNFYQKISIKFKGNQSPEGFYFFFTPYFTDLQLLENSYNGKF